MRTTTVRAATAALTFAAIAALAGCTDNDTSGMPMGNHSATPANEATPSGSSEATGTFNGQDVMFAQMMIPHHEQAIEMSDLILAKPGVDAEVTELAEQIKSAQGPEIATMNEWLTDWGADPSPSPMGHEGHDMGGDDGMMSQADLDALEQATGDQAARLFLSGMIKHHEGAVTMAETESQSGQNPDAKELARNIIDTQQAEIETMTELLGRF